MIYPSHHNSNQGYLIQRLLFGRDGRLEEIAQVSTLSRPAMAPTSNVDAHSLRLGSLLRKN